MSEEPRLRIDWVACSGYGVCEGVAPDLIELDDWGYPVLLEDPIPRELLGQARKAVGDCPMLALSWESREAATGGRLGRLRGRLWRDRQHRASSAARPMLR